MQLAAQRCVNQRSRVLKWITRWISPQGRPLFLQSSRNVSVNIVNSNNQLLTQLITGKAQQDPHPLLSPSSLMFLSCHACCFGGVRPDNVYLCNTNTKPHLFIPPQPLNSNNCELFTPVRRDPSDKKSYFMKKEHLLGAFSQKYSIFFSELPVFLFFSSVIIDVLGWSSCFHHVIPCITSDASWRSKKRLRL